MDNKVSPEEFAAAEAEYAKWIESLPETLREFSRGVPFRPGDVVYIKSERFYFVGFAENTDVGKHGVVISPVNPSLDLHASLAAKQILTEGNNFEKITIN